MGGVRQWEDPNPKYKLDDEVYVKINGVIIPDRFVINNVRSVTHAIWYDGFFQTAGTNVSYLESNLLSEKDARPFLQKLSRRRRLIARLHLYETHYSSDKAGHPRLGY